MEHFWKVVESSVAVGHLVSANSVKLKADSTGSAKSSRDLSNTVIILPRIVPRLHPVHTAQADHIYQDLVAWDVDFMIQMLQEFLRISSAKTLPTLDEYRILPDKVRVVELHSVEAA